MGLKHSGKCTIDELERYIIMMGGFLLAFQRDDLQGAISEKSGQLHAQGNVFSVT